MRPFDSVILNEDLPQYQLSVGTEGTIVDRYQAVEGVFIVEFFDASGKTLEVVDVHAEQITVILSDFFEGEKVALLHDHPQQKLLRGQVGQIRERLGVGLYRVEFADASGDASVSLNLHAQQLLLLHWDLVKLG